MITWHDVKQGSPEWHKLRKYLWTGSRAIKLLMGKPLPDDSNTYTSDAMKRGTALEPIAIGEYERKYRCKVWRPGFGTNSVYTNAGYSPDGIDKKILLEVKCPGGKNFEAFRDTGFIPIEYMAQIQFGMVITGLRHARLIVYNPDYGDSMIIIEVPYLKYMANNIRKLLQRDMKKRSSAKSEAS
jgi:hypothetical protein